MKPKENYADVIRSLRTCAGIDPTAEGCEGCIFEMTSCYHGTRLLSQAAWVIEDLRELCGRLQGEKKGVVEKDESVRELQMETVLHDDRTEPVQTKEGLGTTYEKKPEAVEAIEKLIDDLRAHADWLMGRPILNEIPVNMLKAARLLEIELQRREYHDLGNSIKDREILQALERIE